MKQYHSSFWNACMETIDQRACYNAYHKIFKIVRADTYELKKMAYQLRYDVYVEENGRADIQKKATQLEKDIYDSHSEHVLMIHKPTRKVVGTVRVVLPQKDNLLRSFPLQAVCDHPFLHMENKALEYCQISRLCVAKEFRRRPEDGGILPGLYYQDKDDKSDKSKTIKRKIPFSPLGLIGAALDIALENRIMNCVWMLDEDQMKSVRQLGFIYKTLGPRLDISGKRQPFVFNIKHSLENMVFENPQCAEVVTNRGKTLKLAHAVERDLWHDDVFDAECNERLFDLMYAKLHRGQISDTCNH